MRYHWFALLVATLLNVAAAIVAFPASEPDVDEPHFAGTIDLDSNAATDDEPCGCPFTEAILYAHPRDAVNATLSPANVHAGAKLLAALDETSVLRNVANGALSLPPSFPRLAKRTRGRFDVECGEVKAICTRKCCCFVLAIAVGACVAAVGGAISGFATKELMNLPATPAQAANTGVVITLTSYAVALGAVAVSNALDLVDDSRTTLEVRESFTVLFTSTACTLMGLGAAAAATEYLEVVHRIRVSESAALFSGFLGGVVTSLTPKLSFRKSLQYAIASVLAKVGCYTAGGAALAHYYDLDPAYGALSGAIAGCVHGVPMALCFPENGTPFVNVP